MKEIAVKTSFTAGWGMTASMEGKAMTYSTAKSVMILLMEGKVMTYSTED